jgi:hypothetical protein
MDPTATLLKVAYAEGVKRALLEHGVDEATAIAQSEAYAEEKLARVEDVASMLNTATGKRVGGLTALTD